MLRAVRADQFILTPLVVAFQYMVSYTDQQDFVARNLNTIMIKDAASAALEQLSGTVERVTFHSEESGFCVLRIKVRGRQELVTAIGNAVQVNAGESIEAQGQWRNDKKFGLQFQCQQLRVVVPSSIEGIEKYLGSGMVKGIGPGFAKVLVRAFGERVFDVIENSPEQLQNLPGIGPKRCACITQAWDAQKVIREIMVFLQSHGVGTARAVRIYKTYGDEAIKKVRANPYALALDIRGIGFKTADQIASNLGIASDSLIRAQAGVRHVLQTLTTSGHCAAWREDLLAASVELLTIEEAIIGQAIEEEIRCERLVKENIDGKQAIYLAPLYQAECAVAKHIERLRQGSLPWGATDYKKALAGLHQATGLMLSASQCKALDLVLSNKVSIITGGPGVGKTTIVKSILQLLREKELNIVLCAPTGRAAKRLSESTGLNAKTIHRQLVFEPHNNAFKHHKDNPLEADCVIVDEASMLDIVLTNQLLKAIPTRAALILIGDVDQLPSVGPGAVLDNLIASRAVATAILKEIFRQANTSQIIINAHRINQGYMPKQSENQQLTDFYFIDTNTPEAIHDKLIYVVSERIPNRFGYHPVRDIQVLAPMNRGGLGTRSLNVDLQAALNPNPTCQVTRFGWTYCPNDKVIQNVNNYDKEVFNGDIGTIKAINQESSEILIRFDERDVVYEYSELDEIALAYAISIHKSQGSEYPVVVIPLAMAHYTMLARNLVYTGVTRGRSLVVIVGQKQALAMAVKNHGAGQRLTHLTTRVALSHEH